MVRLVRTHVSRARRRGPGRSGAERPRTGTGAGSLPRGSSYPTQEKVDDQGKGSEKDWKHILRYGGHDRRTMFRRLELAPRHAFCTAPGRTRTDGRCSCCVREADHPIWIHSLHSNAAPATASWLPWLPSAPPWPPSARPQTPPRQRPPHRARCASGQHRH